MPKCIVLSKDEKYFYDNMIENLTELIDKHTISLFKELDLSQHHF